jgi:TolB-like protein/Flp pilus assembly protein TadD
MVSGVGVNTADVQAVVNGQRRRRVLIASGAVVAAAALGVILWQRVPNEGTAATSATASVSSGPAIAVLPFATISSDSSDEYLAAGMTDQLTSALARVAGWRVASRRAVEQQQDADTTSGGFAKSLGLTHTVEGAVQRQGERLRVAVRLVDAATGFSLWSDVYQYQMADIFAVQDEITGRIVEAIGGALGTGRTAAGATTDGTEAEGTSKPEAYEHYLRARFLFARRDETSLREALGEYQAAIKVDSSFARAHAGVASVYAVLPLYTRVPRSQVQDSAMRAAERAISMDSTVADGYAARGVLHNAAWNWPQGEADLRRAIALDSMHAAAHQWLGDNLFVNGRVSEAVAIYRDAVRLDPVTPILRASYGYALAAAGQRDSSIAQGREAIRLDPANPIVRLLVGHAHLALGRNPQALKELETANSQAPNVPLVMGGLGAALVANGIRDRAEDLVTALEKFPPRSGASAAIGKIRLALGDVSGALVALQRAVLDRDEVIGNEAMITPLYDPLRPLPQFAEILRAARLDVARLTARRQ